LVLDASAALALCLEDEPSERIDQAIREHRQAVAPALWSSETAQGLLNAARQGRLTPDGVARSSDLLRRLSVRLDAAVFSRVLGSVLPLAREYGLSIYDASYLELAMREHLPLATLDRALGRAAREAGVELLV
jgi:predicted nucleic acid-binding protein